MSRPKISRNSWFFLALMILILLSIRHGKILEASFYSIESLKKEGTWDLSKGRMANNEYFDENALTAASRDFPLKTKLKIINIKDPKKSVIVEVTDRTNKRFKGKRIDLTPVAFRCLDKLEAGLVEVEAKRIK